MQKVIVYIHGKNGDAGESIHFKRLFPFYDVIGFDYKSTTPWDAIEEFVPFFDLLQKEYKSVRIIANSIGAYFAMNALNNVRIEKAYFISPVVDMEQLITDMIQWAGISEDELKENGEIETTFGETLSYKYLNWVRLHHFSWTVPTSILYGSNDYMQSLDTISKFIGKNKGAELTVMKNGEHWFHTEEQMEFLDEWICRQIHD